MGGPFGKSSRGKRSRGGGTSATRAMRGLATAWLGLLVCCASSEVTSEESTASRPNVLWIVVEDISPHLGCYGETGVQTPVLDQMAHEGVRFERVIMPAPVCSPCRSALITGVMQTTLGTHNHHSSRTPESAIPLPPGLSTIPELFRAAGYFTFNSGKDDYNFAYDRRDLYAGDYDEHPLYGKRGVPIDWRDRQRPDQPFFGQIQLYGGKHIFKRDERFDALVKTRVDRSTISLPPYYPRTPEMVEAWARYLEAIQITDREVGDILARLADDGLLDNTLVIFFSDHGARFWRHKQFLYEGGVAVPTIARWGDRLTPSSVRSDLVNGLDISATSLAAAGIALPDHLDGVDLFAADHRPRDVVISARDRCDYTIDRIRSVRTERFKYIRNFMVNRPAMQPNYRDEWDLTQSIRALYADGLLDEHQAQHFRAARVPEELYDLESDPHELVNLATRPSHADVLRQHREILSDWIEQTDDQGQYPESAEGLRLMLGIWGDQAVNPEYDALRAQEPALAGSLWNSKKQQPFTRVGVDSER